MGLRKVEGNGAILADEMCAPRSTRFHSSPARG